MKLPKFTPKLREWIIHHQVALLHILGGLCWLPSTLSHLHWLWILPWIGGAIILLAASMGLYRYLKNRWKRNKEAKALLESAWLMFSESMFLVMRQAEERQTTANYVAQQLHEPVTILHKSLKDVLNKHPKSSIRKITRQRINQTQELESLLSSFLSQSGLMFDDRVRNYIESLKNDVDLVEFDRLRRISKDLPVTEQIFVTLIPKFEAVHDKIRKATEEGLDELEAAYIKQELHNIMFSAQWQNTSRLHTYKTYHGPMHYRSDTFGRESFKYLKNGQWFTHTVAGYDKEMKNLFLKVVTSLVKRSVLS